MIGPLRRTPNGSRWHLVKALRFPRFEPLCTWKEWPLDETAVLWPADLTEKDGPICRQCLAVVERRFYADAVAMAGLKRARS